MNNKVTWFVCRFPTKEANEGTVMWELEYDTIEECNVQCKLLQQQFPSEYFVSDSLEDIVGVYNRDVAPTLKNGSGTVH